MKGKIKDRSKILLAFLLLLAVSIFSDMSKSSVVKDGYVERGEMTEEEILVQLQLDAEELLKNYPYSLEVSPLKPTQEEANKYFEEAIKEITKDFLGVEKEVPLKKSYCDGRVKAQWSFQPAGVINAEGKVYTEKIVEEMVVSAQVELESGAYETIYSFSFLLYAPVLSESELLLQKIEEWLKTQSEMEGTEEIQLPSKINGIELQWTERKEYITPQIIVLEVLGFVIFEVLSRRNQAEEKKKRMLQMERDYPDVVSQMALLLGAGMTTRQAWNRIASQYKFKCEHKMIEKRMVFEGILRMARRLAEGETERSVYEKFTEEISAHSYRKLMRMLLGSLEKGSQGVAKGLEEESRLAFEKRILNAKKQGEEVSTKMLIPLMLMMMIVMGIVILPALIGFQI